MEIQLINEGNTAEVYSWEEGKVLKLFRQSFPLGGVEQEYKVNKEVEKLGLPIPKAEEMIQYNGRNGIVYERVTGEAVLKLITTKPLMAKKHVKHIAGLQYEMHQCKAKELGSYKNALAWNITHTSALPDCTKESILRMLDQLPEGDSLCHGDFHPGNIIKSKDKYVILDWMTAASGNPGMDVARTVLLIKDAGVPDYMPDYMKAIILIMRKRMLKQYLRTYKKLSGMTQEEIDCWRLPILAARLVEWIPDTEQRALIQEIVQTLR